MQARAQRIDLDEVTVKTPCPMKWAELDGDGARRYCGECALHVVDLSALTRSSAQEFLDERVGDERVCVTYTRRADGSLVTADAAPGRRRRRWKVLAQAAAAFLFTLFPVLPACRPVAVDGNATGPDPDPGPPGDGEATCTELLGEVALPEATPGPTIEVPEAVLGRLATPVPPN